MSGRTDFNTLWFIDLSTQPKQLERLSKICRQHNLSLVPWQRQTDGQLGIILISGTNSYEQLISVLNIQLKHQHNRIAVLNTDAEALSTAMVIRILNYGAEYFYEQKDLDENFDCIIEKFNRWRNIEIMMQAPAVTRNIIGGSGSLKKTLRSIIEVAAYSDNSVLIQGERGTGKELIARLIHEIDRKRANNNIVLVDCTTIRAELAGSEFFGHEKGAYTGADNHREGAFALANNGTLFLDEVGELPLDMQAELLRVIQEGTYKKLGSNIWKQTSFRLVCATNRDLLQECEKGTFRKDLYDRISIWKCFMPSLNERKEDIPNLVNFFLQKAFGGTLPVIAENVMEYLVQRPYPGNIRELHNLVSRIGLLYIGKGPITLGDIPRQDRSDYLKTTECWYEHASLTERITEALNSGYDAKQIMDTIKSMVTRIALATANNNKEVSLLLGKSERWIQLQKAKER